MDKTINFEKIDSILRCYILKWIEEDKHDLGIGTIRRKDLAQAIYNMILNEKKRNATS